MEFAQAWRVGVCSQGKLKYEFFRIATVSVLVYMRNNWLAKDINIRRLISLPRPHTCPLVLTPSPISALLTFTCLSAGWRTFCLADQLRNAISWNHNSHRYPHFMRIVQLSVYPVIVLPPMKRRSGVGEASFAQHKAQKEKVANKLQQLSACSALVAFVAHTNTLRGYPQKGGRGLAATAKILHNCCASLLFACVVKRSANSVVTIYTFIYLLIWFICYLQFFIFFFTILSSHAEFV